MSGLSPARKAAFSILKKVEKGGHSDTLLRGRSVEILSDADRKLTTALVLGTLREQIALDQRIRVLLKHPHARLDAEVSIALRMGAFQLLYMQRIPARAAIDESVELTKQAGHRFASGMVNAVLRKLAGSEREPPDARQAYPTWMVERWTMFYGEDLTHAICKYGQEPPAVSLRSGKDSIDTELADSIELGPGEFLTAARRVISGDVAKTHAFHQGCLRIQDEGSQLIAELVPRGESLLDCCAAPGGKTLILAERNPGANLVACETSPSRMAQLRERLKIFGERVRFQLSDATRLDGVEAFDVVLADVPCSGTGTLGRNPEIRHRLEPEKFKRQAERQMALLQSALGAVRAGGHVLYSTCSLEPEENEQVVGAVLSQNPHARVVSLHAKIEELHRKEIVTGPGRERLLGSITAEGYLRLLPGVFHTDGFFAALLEKTG